VAELSERRRRLTLVAMCTGQGMILLDNTIVNVALPSIQQLAEREDAEQQADDRVEHHLRGDRRRQRAGLQ
jgi:hypothetical protein